MTDRELLELAAKAAGVRYTINDDEYYKSHKFFGLWLVYDDEPSEYARRYWNPLTDDGDALRLAVKLDLLDGPSDYRVFKAIQFGVEPYAATRRAIVRAAAEIGKGLK